MSALGHKQTFSLQQVMSAPPSKADMCIATDHVGFGPEASPFHNEMRSLWTIRSCEHFYTDSSLEFLGNRMVRNTEPKRQSVSIQL
jgi:hypothetical protein